MKMVYARCGFCETCFVLASIATLTYGSPLQDDAQSTQISKDQYDSPATNVLFDNNDTTGIESKPSAKIYEYDSKEQKKSDKQSSTEGWCVVWYLGAFGSLVCFFLIITCMELFFRMPHYRQNNLAAFIQNMTAENKSYVPETPPPPYHLFAPPDYYETVQKAANDKRQTMDIFVIPVYQKPSTVQEV